jgi:hypothetical protein
MASIKNGFLSGLLATVIAGSMLLMNNALHQFPEVQVARTLSGMLGAPDQFMVGVIAILSIGIFVFGALFAVLAPRLPFPTWLGKGLAFGAASWLVMMVVYMPLGGAGLFGLERSGIVPVVTLVLNLAYWVVLSLTYRWLSSPAELTDRVET